MLTVDRIGGVDCLGVEEGLVAMVLVAVEPLVDGTGLLDVEDTGVTVLLVGIVVVAIVVVIAAGKQIPLVSYSET